MGEEEKKPQEQKVEEKKAEEVKKVEAKGDEEKKEEKKTDETKESKEPPPAPPQEIILRVYMHCEGCARKVRRCLKRLEGVEEVHTDCKTHKVVVKGEKADPLKVLERLQKKSHRQVELLSPIPKSPADEPKKVEEKEPPKPQEKKPEPQVVTVVLKVHMHCEACAQLIKKRIQRMQGVESTDPDLKSSQVTIKGAFEPVKLVEYVHKRTGKHAVIVKQEPEKKEEKKDKGKEEKEEKKVDEGDKDVKKGEQGEKKEGGEAADNKAAAAVAAPVQEEAKVMETKKNEIYYTYPTNYQIYPPRIATEMYAYPPPPQMFSDENPNACYVM